MLSAHELRTTFNNLAELYDEVRPTYPAELVADVLVLSGIPAGGRILEIGCGTGQATLPFARRGYAMLCLELGANLARLAREQVKPFPAVEIQNIAFEDWTLPARAFDLVICAEAFHWISPAVRWRKTAAALKTGASLALFWNDHLGGGADFSQAIDQVYRELAPQLLGMKNKPRDELENDTVAEMAASGLFAPAILKRYPWRIKYTADQFEKLISTYSPIASLPVQLRQELLTRIRAVIEKFGGAIESEYVSRLYFARVGHCSFS
ncbi:MAG: class I SAM-dependent methyltransferase [Chloroflexi bacterium]|nr:class I SAM-dependent methyltransferase [Chloroflexota bacterium]